jgi:hypothetical protein
MLRDPIDRRAAQARMFPRHPEERTARTVFNDILLFHMATTRAPGGGPH